MNTIKQTINHTKHIITEPMKRHLKQIHPKAPTIQALPKIHKTDIPIRPVIIYQQAPAYKLAKHMDKIIRQHIDIKTETYIRNSTDLIHTIKDIPIPYNSTLASFDIVNFSPMSPFAKQSTSLKPNSEKTRSQKKKSQKSQTHYMS